MMKNLKKLASIALALVMALSLAVPAFAAEAPIPGRITIDNPKAGETYKAYKIFDVVYDEGKTSYSYTITASSDWYDAVSKYATDEANGLTLTPSASNPAVYVVTVTDGFSAPAFAAYLNLKVEESFVSYGFEEVGTTLVANVPTVGYYFVTSTLGALCDLTTTNPEVTIHEKNDVPFDKTIDDHSVEVGQVVNFTLTAKVPDTTGFTNYIYVMTDAMSEGLTFNGLDTIKVTIGGAAAKASDYTAALNEAGNGFVLTFHVMQFKGYNVGDEIVVTYSATVNEGAVIDIEENDAKLEYSNDPTDYEKTKEIEDKEYVYSAKIVVDKFDGKDTDKKLAGAEFILLKKNGDEITGYYYYDEATKKVSWDAKNEDGSPKYTVAVTDEDGAVEFIGLEDGTYYLREIKAPDGYNPLTADEEIVIDDRKVLTDNGTGVPSGVDFELQLTHGVEVPNNTGAQMPSTGGIGTTIFYTVGGLMVVAAGILLVTKRRMDNSEK